MVKAQKLEKHVHAEEVMQPSICDIRVCVLWANAAPYCSISIHLLTDIANCLRPLLLSSHAHTAYDVLWRCGLQGFWAAVSLETLQAYLVKPQDLAEMVGGQSNLWSNVVAIQDVFHVVLDRQLQQEFADLSRCLWEVCSSNILCSNMHPNEGLELHSEKTVLPAINITSLRMPQASVKQCVDLL